MDRMRRALYVSGFFLFVLVLQGCGQSGALYLPGNPSQMTVPATEPGVAAEDEEDADNGDSD